MTHRNRIAKYRNTFLSGLGAPEQGEFVVDAFQKNAIDSAVSGHDTLVVAPTGAGKTFIAIEAIRAYLDMGLKSVYTTPLKALSNTKYNDLKRIFEPAHSVGLLTGDRKIETDADVVIATTEIYRNELYSGTERYSLVVLDEVHFIADPQRGAVWEESIILTPKDASLLMLSASISNAAEIASWLSAIREKPCTIISETVRPVELRLGFLHPEYGVIPLRNEKGSILKEVTEYYSHGSEGTVHGPFANRKRGGRFGGRGRGPGRGGRRSNPRGKKGR
ncbi:MAG: DEAD/DEAH box helicase [Bdellovibrionales bacterium]|nr:DEAD/DEAH box helicase [Bdellovibrionales bacterium]